MEETDYSETATTSHPPAETSDVEVELNIKMLDSQSHTLRVKKNMTVLAFKEQISSAVALPAAQQRLIFRGKVLKDEHLLSDYNVEDGHTLHLVARQPAQEAQPGSGDSDTNQRAPEPSDGGSRNRTGQISHSVVLGTFNLGEQNDNIVPDISRIIGAVLNSIGANISTAGGAGQADQASNVGQGSISEQASQGGPIGATRASDGGIDQSENRTPPVQAPPNVTFQALHPPFEFPPGFGATTLPSHPLVVPHSLVTLSEYMNRMDTVLSRMGASNQSSSIPSNVRHEETPPLRGLPNPEHLSSVIRHTQQLLTGHATAMLSHLSGRLDGQQGIVDPSLRAQIQAEAYQTGLAVQHLGSLLLEIGRTILTLQMGQSPADSVVNAGPAVYISSRGPNPLMVQPSPHQAGSLFGANPPIPLQFAGALGNANPTIGDISRHLNIHITAAASGMQPVVARLSAGAVPPGQQTVVPNSTSILNSSAPGESGAPHALPVGANHVSSSMHPHQPGTHQVQSNQATPGIPSRSGAPTSSDADAARGIQHSSLSSSLLQQPSVRSSIRAEDTVMQQPELVPRSTSDSLEGRVSSASRASSSYQDTSMNALKLDDKPEAKATPIGLGAGGLQPLPSKRKPRTVKQGKEGDTSSQAVTQSKEAISQGQNILATLASQGRSIPSKDVNGSIPPLPVGNSDISDLSTSNGRVSLDSMISQVLQTPGINDLIAGMSEPTGGATPDVLSSMMGQIARNPALSNVLGQAMQAMDGKDIGGMLAGLGSSGGGNNLSAMIQQMLPVMSRSLGNLSLPPASTLDGGGNNQLFQRDGVRGVESVDSLVDMFHKLVQDTADSLGQGADSSGLVDELSNDEELVNEFVNFLSRSLRRPADS